jgi:hypothetical protein
MNTGDYVRLLEETLTKEQFRRAKAEADAEVVSPKKRAGSTNQQRILDLEKQVTKESTRRVVAERRLNKQSK